MPLALNERTFRTSSKYCYFGIIICIKCIFSSNICIFLEDDIAATGNNDRIEMNIYAEDEEMTPAIDIENEEVEDDIEFDIENEETSKDKIEFYIN